MLKQLYNRYIGLSNAKQLGISFLLNFIFWFLVSYFIRSWFFDKEFSVAEHLFDAIFMAVFNTMFWRKFVKFPKNTSQN